MLPIVVRTFRALFGDDESKGALLLADLYSPGGSQNVYLDKLGRIRGIDGYTKQNTTARTTDTGASTAIFRSLFPYRKTSGGSFTRQVIGVLDDQVNEYEIWTSTDEGVAWTFRADLGTGLANKIPDFAQFGDTLIIAIPTAAPRSWDGTTLTTAGATQLVAPTTSLPAGAGVLAGAFQYRIIPMLTAGTRKPGSVASAVRVATLKKIKVDWTADSDTDVVGYEIYRTSGTGKIFYFVTYSNGRTTVTYTDNTPDLDVVNERILEEHGDAPPSGAYFCEAHAQRMWYGRTDADPQRVYHSDPGDPDSVYVGSNYFTLADGETMGDVLTGHTGNFRGMLVCWQERSVWAIAGTGQIAGLFQDWTRRKTACQIGAVSHRTVARIPVGAKYTTESGQVIETTAPTLAYFTALGDIRLFDGDADAIISTPKKDLLGTVNYEHRAKIQCVLDLARSLVVWYFPAGSATEPDTAVVWDYQHATWHEWLTQPFASVVALESATIAQTLLASDARIATGGFVYKLWSGNSFDGAAIDIRVMTVPLFPTDEQGVDLTRRLRARWLLPLFAKDASPTTVVIGIFPYDAADSDTAALERTVTGSSRQRTALVYTSGTKIGRTFQSYGCRLRLESNVTSGAWILEGLTFAHQILPGQRR